jgi:quinol monooxygenase YgiN
MNRLIALGITIGVLGVVTAPVPGRSGGGTVAPRFPLRSRDGDDMGAAHPAMIYLVKGVDVIFIAVKFPVRAARSADWMDLVDDFTQATRREPGNLFFEWSRSVEDPNEFVLVEAFRDAEAGREHVQSAHFKEAMEVMSYAVGETPKIVSIEVPDREGWDLMGEITPREA